MRAPYADEMRVLSTTPAIWHGNGDRAMKAIYKRYAENIITCINSRN